MNVWFIIIILAFIAFVFYMRHKKRKAEPKVLARKPPVPELQMLQATARKLRPAPTEPVERRHAKQVKPTRPVHDSNGTRYYPNTDGTYRNTETTATVTWLMLYVLMNDSYRDQFVEPEGYTPGITFEEAVAISEPELQQLAEAQEIEEAATAEAIALPDNISSDQPEPVTEKETETRSSDASITEIVQANDTPTQTNDSAPVSNNDTSSSYNSDSTF